MADATKTVKAGKPRLSRSPEGSGRSDHRSERKPLVGSTEPRLFTPPLRPLTPKTSDGFEVVEFWKWVVFRLREEARRRPEDEALAGLLLNVGDPDPWQEWFLIHALELLPNGQYRFKRLLLLVARQNGKTLLAAMMIMWRLFNAGCRSAIGVAQKEEKATETWQLVVDMARALPELGEDIVRAPTGNGKTGLHLTNRAVYKPQPANQGGGRGFTAELVFFDELQDHTDFKSWSAATNSTRSIPRAQVFAAATAGTLAAVVVRRLRGLAKRAIAGEEMSASDRLAVESLGMFEWSAPDGCALTDRDGWRQANPALGHGRVTEESIAASLADPEWEFRMEVLCQHLDAAASGPFPTPMWRKGQYTPQELLADPSLMRDVNRPAEYGLDMSYSGSLVSISVAYFDVMGRPHVQHVARRAGTDWPIGWLSDPARKIPAYRVAVQGAGAPASSMIASLERAGFEVVPVQGKDLPIATGQFYNAIRGEELLHISPQPAFDAAAAQAVQKTAGDAWLIDRKQSRSDAAPLQAGVNAYWLLMNGPEVQTSVYETRDLLVLDD